MSNERNEIVSSVVKHYGLPVKEVIPNNGIYKIITNDNKTYILKKVKNRGVFNIYYFLMSQKFTNFIMPLLTTGNHIFMMHDNDAYYLTRFYEDIDYPLDKKLMDYIDLLHKLHQKTIIKKHFDKDQFNRLYKKKLKRLESRFQLLDLFIIECENKKYRSIFDWTYLTRYNDIMYIKNVLVKLQSQIDTLLEELKLYDYCIIHNNPSIDHFVVTNEHNYLISFDYSTIGLKVHDYVKLFIDYSEYNIDWLNLITIDEVSSFEIYYFIFNVLYYILRNIDITFLSKNNQYEAINSLIHSLHVAEKAVDLYQKYEETKLAAETSN